MVLLYSCKNSTGLLGWALSTATDWQRLLPARQGSQCQFGSLRLAHHPFVPRDLRSLMSSNAPSFGWVARHCPGRVVNDHPAKEVSHGTYLLVHHGLVRPPPSVCRWHRRW